MEYMTKPLYKIILILIRSPKVYDFCDHVVVVSANDE